MKFYVGPWQWKNDKLIGRAGWSAPDNAICLVDLRPVPAQSLAEEVTGFGCFATPDDIDLGVDYRLFGSGKSLTDVVPNGNDRAVFASMVGVGKVDGSSLAEWLFTLSTLYADPLGTTAMRPLMPIGGKVLRAFGIEKPFLLSSPEAAGVVENIKNDYRKIREASLDGKLGADDLQHRRVLDFLGKQYGIDNPQDVFIPDDLPKDTPVLHATTIHDDFDRAAAASMGTATVGGVSQGWSWTDHSVIYSGGTVNTTTRWDVNGAHTGQIEPPDTQEYAFSRAGAALSSADHYAELQTGGVVGNYSENLQVGPTCRRATGADVTCYVLIAVPTTDLGFYLQKQASNGVGTVLGNYNSTQVATYKFMRLTVSGSSIVGRYDGTDIMSTTDTTITGNVNCGLMGYTPFSFPNTRIYDFSASDVAAPPSGVMPSIYKNMNQAVRRVSFY